MAHPRPQQPAVIFIARHGPRLDAADATWHLSTPTPYDPPLTYGGWNQSRALGTRIASLLHAREQSHLYEQRGEARDRPRKRRRLKHRVIIHSSPFLRCLQTSIAISAGLAQYKAPVEATVDQKRPSSASPRLRTADTSSSPRNLPAIPEPRHDFAHAIARKTLHDHQRYRKSQLRVDAFLGEWLNTQYFEGITAPPPSAMMLATAKAELWDSESVEFFRPTIVTTPSTSNNLWPGAARTGSRESPLDEWSPVDEMIPRSPVRSRANSQDSPVGNESGRKSPFRPGSPLLPLTSTFPKPEPSTYRPPVPQYAVSTSHQIPRGYVTHAREACTDVDYSWDSSRAPQNWGDGGSLGEEWSELHRRFRKGINCLVEWYGQFDTDEQPKESITESSETHGDDKEQEELVLVLVTHGAGCNALIGALTAQPVLLDVAMASLTMAVRRDDASPLTADRFSRRGSLDSGLNSIYEVKIVASTEHLRHAVAPQKTSFQFGRADTALDTFRETPQRPRNSTDNVRGNTNSSLGSIRRPSAVVIGGSRTVSSDSKQSLAGGEGSAVSKLSPGLWTPSAGRTTTARSNAQQQYLPLTESKLSGTSILDESMMFGSAGHVESTEADASNYPPNDQLKDTQISAAPDTKITTTTSGKSPQPDPAIPPDLSRRLSQKGLWGNRPSGAQVERRIREPKRRWTVDQD